MGEVLKFRLSCQRELPILIVSGLPGDEKARFIERLVESRADLTFGLIDQGTIPLPESGCPSCAARGAITKQLSGFFNDKSVDYVLLAPPLWCEIEELIHFFNAENEFLPDNLRGHVRLDAILSLVDLKLLAGELDASRENADRPTEDFEELVNGFEHANVLAIANDSLEVTKLKEQLRLLQPSADLIVAEEPIDPTRVLNLRAQNGKNALKLSGISQICEHFQDQFSFSYPFRSDPSRFVYRRRRPFHPERIWELLSDWPSQILRSWGNLWVATRDYSIGISQFGPLFYNLRPEGNWLVSLGAEELQYLRESNGDLFRFWDAQLGDKFTEIVFLSPDLDLSDLIARLDACLLTDLEMKRDWSNLSDPMPSWKVDEVSEEGAELDEAKPRKSVTLVPPHEHPAP